MVEGELAEGAEAVDANTLWVHPFNGIAGDMMLGALLDVGADRDAVVAELASLEVDGWELSVERVERNGIGATNVSVVTSPEDHHVHRRAGDIISLVERADLAPRVRHRSIRVFEELAEAEGRVHGVDPSQVHFHEVGGIDAIIDVVGTCLALEDLAIDRIVVAPVAVGHGITGSAHGRIPHPAPATSHLLSGIATRGLDVPVELTTPTGAAIVRALADGYGELPPMTVASVGFGAGDATIDGHPNLLQVISGRSTVDDPNTDSETLMVVETNVDDLSGEYVAHAVQQLLDAGALDAWWTPITMKRDRPAVVLSALVRPVEVAEIGEVLLRESGSLGYRAHGVSRRAAARRFDHVDVDGHTIAVKVSPHGVKAEYVDVAAAARATGRSARSVAAEAEELWRRRVAP